MQVQVWVQVYTVNWWGWEWNKNLIPVEFWYNDGRAFFLLGWDNEIRSHHIPLSSLVVIEFDASSTSFSDNRDMLVLLVIKEDVSYVHL